MCTSSDNLQSVPGVLEYGPERRPPRLVVERPSAGHVLVAAGGGGGGRRRQQGVAKAAKVATAGSLEQNGKVFLWNAIDITRRWC